MIAMGCAGAQSVAAPIRAQPAVTDSGFAIQQLEVPGAQVRFVKPHGSTTTTILVEGADGSIVTGT